MWSLVLFQEENNSILIHSAGLCKSQDTLGAPTCKWIWQLEGFAVNTVFPASPKFVLWGNETSRGRGYSFLSSFWYVKDYHTEGSLEKALGTLWLPFGWWVRRESVPVRWPHHLFSKAAVVQGPCSPHCHLRINIYAPSHESNDSLPFLFNHVSPPWGTTRRISGRNRRGGKEADEQWPVWKLMESPQESKTDSLFTCMPKSIPLPGLLRQLEAGERGQIAFFSRKCVYRLDHPNAYIMISRTTASCQKWQREISLWSWGQVVIDPLSSAVKLWGIPQAGWPPDYEGTCLFNHSIPPLVWWQQVSRKRVTPSFEEKLGGRQTTLISMQLEAAENVESALEKLSFSWGFQCTPTASFSPLSVSLQTICWDFIDLDVIFLRKEKAQLSPWVHTRASMPRWACAQATIMIKWCTLLVHSSSSCSGFETVTFLTAIAPHSEKCSSIPHWENLQQNPFPHNSKVWWRESQSSTL